MISAEATKKLFFLHLCACLFLLPVASPAQDQVRTPAEAADFLSYSQHEDITRFLGTLDNLSRELTVQVVGATRAVRGFPSKDLYLCVINAEGVSEPQSLNRTKPTFMITASQHGNEQSAKEAALQLVRDLSTGELKPLLEKVNFLIMPQANPYGNAFDTRQNEQGLDLNRDHVKLESEETAAIHHVFRAWMPEVTMDVHEKGDDYYRVSIGRVSNANIDPRLADFSKTKILKEVEQNLAEINLTFMEYLVSQEMGIDSSAGVRYQPGDLRNRETMLRYSTTDLNDGRNSLGIYETLSFIQECASRHDLETLKERTRWQYYGIRFTAEAVAAHGSEITTLVRSLREALLRKAGTYSEQDLVHLKMDYTRDPNDPELTLKRFERTRSPIRGILKVDKKAGDALTAADIAPNPAPEDQKVVAEVVKNWFPGVEATLSIARPLGYVIPAGHDDVVETLLRHGLTLGVFAQDRTLEIEAYQIGDVVPAEYDYLPPEKIEVVKKALTNLIRKGDFYISCNQPGADLIPSLLEPQSDYGLIRYRSYKLVPGKGDFFAFSRVVKAQDLPVVPYKGWERR